MTLSRNLQYHTNLLKPWLEKRKIKINDKKSIHITFTLLKKNAQEFLMIMKIYQNETMWNTWECTKTKGSPECNIKKKKRQQLKILSKKFYRRIGKSYGLFIQNTLLLYACVLNPVSTYEIQLWGDSTIVSIQISSNDSPLE